MKEYKIIIKGTPRTKKNGQTFSFKYKDRNGIIRFREHPVVFLKKPYREWTKKAVQALAVFKSKHPRDEFPIPYKVNLKVVSYIPSKIARIDQSALYEGIQDVLCGKSSTSVRPELFQILKDDSYQYVGGHDGSRIYIDNKNPRMEVTITPMEE